MPSPARTQHPLALSSTIQKKAFKRLEIFLDAMLFPYRDGPYVFREALVLRLRQQVLDVLGLMTARFRI
jgi:hypothetical protein